MAIDLEAFAILPLYTPLGLTTRLRCLFAHAYGIGHTTELVRVLQCLLRVLRKGLSTLIPIRHFFPRKMLSCRFEIFLFFVYKCLTWHDITV